MLNVRVATPPPRAEGVPPGQMSSYIFNLKEGDKVIISGPFGEFFARDTQAEMVFIGGGAGMAPMRAHIFDQLQAAQAAIARSASGTARVPSARCSTTRTSTCSHEERELRVARGAVRSAARGRMEGTPASSTRCCTRTTSRIIRHPRTCEFYMCGPPMMNQAVLKMLDDLGVEKEHILFDDFGG
jgi:Na+-transporting NADH:ubiquinone oxidoreductase subunit F